MSNRQTIDLLFGVGLLQDEKGIGYTDRTFVEATARRHLVGWVLGDEAVEGGIELFAGSCGSC